MTESTMKYYKKKSWLSVVLFAFLLIFASSNVAFAVKTSIVVVPHYVEQGLESKDSADQQHFRRLIRVINNRLVKSGFEVINAAATEAIVHDREKDFEISKSDSRMNGESICHKYGTDLAYLLWVKIKVKKTSDGMYRVRAFLEGECYDSAGRDVGASISKIWKLTKRDREEAIWKVEEDVAYKLARVLTAWKQRGTSSTYKSNNSNSVVNSGGNNLGSSNSNALQKRSDSLRNSYRVNLRGATEHTVTEVFGKVLNTASGVLGVVQKSSKLVPDNPQLCLSIWAVEVENTDAFRLQANINKMIKDVIAASGNIVLKGVPYRYSGYEVELLNGIRPSTTTSRSVEFVIDTERARDSDFVNGFD